MSLLTLGGIISRKYLQSTLWNTNLALNIKNGHKLFGYLSLILAQATVITGGLKYEEKGHAKAKGLVILQAVITLILLIGLEIRHRVSKRT